MVGAPFVHPEFVKKFLQNKNSEHKVLLDRIPAMALAVILRGSTVEFLPQNCESSIHKRVCAGTRRRGVAVLLSDIECPCRLRCPRTVVLLLWEGGIGLRSARRTAPAARWASWADALKMIRDRHPAVVDIILDALRRPEESMTIRTVVECAAVLERTGFESHLRRIWRSPGESREEEDPSQPRVGWQQQLATSIERHYHDNTVWPGLREHEKAMMRSVHWRAPRSHVSRRVG